MHLILYLPQLSQRISRMLKAGRTLNTNQCYQRRQWHPIQYFCLENPMDGGAWQAAVHGVAEGRTRLSDCTFTSHFHALEKEMATHSSVLAWRIPGTGEPGGRTESGTTERLHFHFSLSCIGEGNGNPLQCSCLENPRDGKPGGLPSQGSHRVGHD